MNHVDVTMFIEFIIGSNKNLANEFPINRPNTQLCCKSQATVWEAKANLCKIAGCLAYKQTNVLCAKYKHIILPDTLNLKLGMWIS